MCVNDQDRSFSSLYALLHHLPRGSGGGSCQHLGVALFLLRDYHQDHSPTVQACVSQGGHADLGVSTLPLLGERSLSHQLKMDPC